MNNYLSKLSKSLLVPVGMLLIGINTVMAQENSAFFGTASPQAIKAVGKGTFGELVTKIINYFLGLLGLIAVAFIIYAGVQLVASAGNEDAVGKAKKIITYAAVGIVIIMLSYTIVTFVSNALS